MRKEREVLIKKMWEVEIASEVDRELGCGYTASDFGYEDLYDKELDRLGEELVKTYGVDMNYFEFLMITGDIEMKLGLLPKDEVPFM